MGGKKGLKVTQTSCLNKLLDVTAYKIIEGYPREDLKILSRHNPMSLVYCQPLVTPNSGRTGVSLFLLPLRHTWSFGDRSWKLFNRG